MIFKVNDFDIVSMRHDHKVRVLFGCRDERIFFQNWVTLSSRGGGSPEPDKHRRSISLPKLAS